MLCYLHRFKYTNEELIYIYIYIKIKEAITYKA